MPRETILQKYNRLAFKAGITPRTKESSEWFQKKVNEISRVDRNSLHRRQEPAPNYLLGNMVMYFYKPKYEKQLPYWDKFPLVIIIDDAKRGFMGLNLHYLPVDLRAKFLSHLLELTTDTNFDQKTRFAVTYDYLKGTREARYFKPCIKRYLTKHIQGNVALVQPDEWEIATFLPTEQFQKRRKITVHRKSREMVR